jgi:hypothetical protein
MSNEKKNERVTVLMCGGKKCCPTLVVKEDGHAEMRGDFGEVIPLVPEQATALKKALEDAGY